MQSVFADPNLPFINQITSIVNDQNGNYSQHLFGEFPALYDANNNRLRFGTDAEFFLAPGVPTYDNGVIKLDELTQHQTLGYIFGGIVSTLPNPSQVAGTNTLASNQIFEVICTPVPEPATIVITLCGVLMTTVACRKKFSAA